TWTGASPGSTYYFYVTAYSSVAGGQSAPSNTATVATPALPKAPSNLTATAASTTQVNLSWTDNSASGPTVATSFKIYRSTDNVNFSWFATAAQGVTTYTWTGGSPATSYSFYVTASAAAGDSGPSNTASVTTMALPAAPSNLTASAASATQV